MIVPSAHAILEKMTDDNSDGCSEGDQSETGSDKDLSEHVLAETVVPDDVGEEADLGQSISKEEC